MSRRPILFLTALGCAAFSLWTACRSTGSCEDGNCPQGQSCDLVSHLCVLGEAIEITSPDGTAVDAGIILLAGRLQFDVGASASYRLQQKGNWVDLPVDSKGSFNALVTLPALNNEAFPIEVRAGRYQATVSPMVDNVPPTAIFSSGKDLSLEPPTLSVSFSEPVFVNESSWLSIYPQATNGNWSDSTHYSAPLPHGSFVRGQIAPSQVHDLFGNALQGQPETDFFTAPAVPPVGRLFPDTDWTAYGIEAAFDADGFVNFAARGYPDGGSTNTGVASWQIFDPQTGEPHEQLQIPSSNFYVHLDGMMTADAGVFPPSHVHGYSFHQHDTLPSDGRLGTTAWKLEGASGSHVGSTLIGIVATPPSCGEPATPPGVGQMWRGPDTNASSSTNAIYSRNAGVSALNFPVQVDQLFVESPDNWTFFSQNGSNLTRGHYERSCLPTPTVRTDFQSTLRSDLRTSPGDAHLSYAVTPSGRSLVVFYDPSSTRKEACYPCMVKPDWSGPCAVEDVRTSVGGDLHVAATHHGEKVVGVRHNPGSDELELVMRDLGDCNGDWELLATIPESDGANARPVMFGLTPGVLYVRQGGLYVFHL